MFLQCFNSSLACFKALLACFSMHLGCLQHVQHIASIFNTHVSYIEFCMVLACYWHTISMSSQQNDQYCNIDICYIQIKGVCFVFERAAASAAVFTLFSFKIRSLILTLIKCLIALAHISISLQRGHSRLLLGSSVCVSAKPICGT